MSREGVAWAVGVSAGVVAWATVASAASVPTVSASDARRLTEQVDRVAGQLRDELQSVAAGYKVEVPKDGGRLQRRMREAEIQSLFDDHYRAAIILSDIAGRAEMRTDPDYPKAMYLLAESLRKAGYPRAAKIYFEELAATESGRGLSQVVLGLLEVASVTGDFAGIDQLTERVKGGDAVEDSKIDYVYGKALYRGAADNSLRLERALQKFRSVPRGLSISSPAAYYSGVTLVKMNRYEAAIREFERSLELSGSFQESQEMQELSQMSMGRLYQELGDVPRALAAYRSISKESPHFSEMLYEVAWVYVAAANNAPPDSPEQDKQYRLALDVTELLMATAPDSVLFPEARVLQGNLRIRLGGEERAYDTFQTVVDVYGGAQKELEVLLASRKDARAFFDELVASDLRQLGSVSLLPNLFLQFALEDPYVADTVEVRRALVSAATELDEARELVRTLETALTSSQRFAMFPGLADSLTTAISVLNRSMMYRQQLMEAQRGIMLRYLDPVSMSKLEAGYFRERDFEHELLQLPLSTDEIDEYRDRLRQNYRSVDHRAFLQLTNVQSMQAQLAAARIWMARHPPQLTPEERTLTNQRLEQAEAELLALTKNVDGLRDEVKRFELFAGSYSGWSRGVEMSKRLRVWEDEQMVILGAFRDRASATEFGVVSRIDEQRKVLREVEAELLSLHSQLDASVEVRVDEVRAQVLKEFRELQKFGAEHNRLSHVSDEMLGPVAAQTITWVGDQFEDLVLKADVGILDVAWARKRARTDEVTGMVRELRKRANDLDKEFTEVLEGN